MILELYRVYEIKIFKGNLVDRLKLFSESYCALLYKKQQRSHDKWECNNIMPIHVFFEVNHINKTCDNCKFTMSHECFNKANPNRCLRCWFKHTLIQREKNFKRKQKDGSGSDEYSSDSSAYECDVYDIPDDMFCTGFNCQYGFTSD